MVLPLHSCCRVSAPSTGSCLLVTSSSGRNALVDPRCNSAAMADCVFFV